MFWCVELFCGVDVENVVMSSISIETQTFCRAQSSNYIRNDFGRSSKLPFFFLSRIALEVFRACKLLYS